MKKIKKYSLGYPTMPGVSIPSSNLPAFNVGDQVRVSPFDYIGRIIDRYGDGDQGPYDYMVEISGVGTGITTEWYPHGMLTLVKDYR